MRIFYYIFTILLLYSSNCFSANTLSDDCFSENRKLLGGIKRSRDPAASDLPTLEAPAPRKVLRRIIPILIAGPAAPAPRKESRRIPLTRVLSPVEPKGAFAAERGAIPDRISIAPTVTPAESEPEPSEYSSSSESETSEYSSSSGSEPSEYSPSSESDLSEHSSSSSCTSESSENASSSDEYSELSESSDTSYVSSQRKEYAYGTRANSSAQSQPLEYVKYFLAPHNNTKTIQKR